MASSLPNKEPIQSCLQVSIPLCDDHVKERLNYYCKICSKPVCETCLQTTHEGHSWSAIDKTAQGYKFDSDSTINEAKELIAKIKGDISRLTAEINTNDRTKCEKLEKIEVREQLLVGEVKQYREALQNLCHRQERTYNRELEDKRRSQEREVEMLEDHVDFFTTRLGSSSSHLIVEYTDDIKQMVERYSSPDTSNLIDRQGFMEGRNEFSEIRGIFGYISGVSLPEASTMEVQLQQVATFDYKAGTDATICFENDDLAYIQCDLSLIQLRNSSGISIQDFNIWRYPKLKEEEVSTFTKLDNGDIVFACRNQKCLWKMASDGMISSVIHQTHSYPTGLLKLRNGNLLVCSTTKSFNNVKSSTGMVSILATSADSHTSTTVTPVHSFYASIDGDAPLFQWPYRAAENRNTDICVVDFSTSKSSSLKVLSNKGKLKFCYQGQFLSKPFLASAVDCDDKCRIIVNDYFNNRIHLLSQEGSFVSFIFHENNSCPWALALSPTSRFMWVSFKRSTIRVFKYKTSIN